MQEMRLKNKEDMLDLGTKIKEKNLEMEGILLEDELDLKKILSIHDEISALRQKISRKRIEHKIEMYKLLPDDKKETARKMFLHGFSERKHGKEGMNNCKGGPGSFMGK
jgi:Spy/CpxP family protein refolding chaperone